ncbi:PKD domain-containing protein [Hydrotalea sandarakina]|jgi:gliding motility-associated-like protein|uniref:Gliding motility-associated-like protein n=1 Tax=Hydrotalea sandarakina TaxID=1004304 RepID=A0A2W7S3I5_9BACT|nr:PKD domain-containing protein [Hydrotalea sandarakina]PZX61529.1 gliding motility-associated-like protein [Hydrotalea sandarakina]
MRKFLFIIFILISCVFKSYAVHIAAGELSYLYQGPGASPNTARYLITMRLFRECNAPANSAQLNGENVTIGIYDKATGNYISQLKLAQQFVGNPPTIQNTPGINPCLTGNPIACYQVGTYSSTIDLPITANGYTLSWVRYSRAVVQNVAGNSVGATFTAEIPGTLQLPNGTNSSPIFTISDTTIVCKNTGFTFNYSASDPDGDSLAYKFAPAYDGTPGNYVGTTTPDPDPSLIPVLQPVSVNYIAPYSGLQPLGSGVTINVNTGLISGVAPPAGKYIVCVVVEEWRNKVLLDRHRKDFILTIGDCSVNGADLNPKYVNCNNFTFNFSNESTNPNIIAYAWKFGDTKNSNYDTSSKPTPTYTYSDTGTYTMKLKVTATGGCTDSATAQVAVFPGFKANFSVNGSCILNPYQFKDLSVAQYGVINSWQWNFGDPNTTSDTSTQQNPTYTYASTGTKTVFFTVTSTKGCVDTLSKIINVPDKPYLFLPFHDTLICSIDTLPLIANSPGSTFQWTSVQSPNSIINATSANPLVHPKDTAVYVVTVNNNGCLNKDSIQVNVLQFITVNAGPDTSICQTDTIQFNTVSYALSYQWKGSNGIPIAQVKYPKVAPLTNTTYYVQANLGKCPAYDTVNVKVFPYPSVSASGNANICFGNTTQLSGTTNADNFSWSPNNTLLNANTLNPTAGPNKTTYYVLTGKNNSGCIKAVSDSVLVKVIQPITIDVGTDTSVVLNQPLQLKAILADSSNFAYSWTPVEYLNNPSISHPIAIINTPVNDVTFTVKATELSSGCTGQSSIVVKVYNTGPDILVPKAFTPNGDGKNDIMRPILLGISRLDYFSIYNRWGQLIYSTSQPNAGWDGTVNGTAQPSGAYIYTAKGVDYLGNTITKNGTIVLIR